MDVSFRKDEAVSVETEGQIEAGVSSQAHAPPVNSMFDPKDGWPAPWDFSLLLEHIHFQASVAYSRPFPCSRPATNWAWLVGCRMRPAGRRDDLLLLQCGVAGAAF